MLRRPSLLLLGLHVIVILDLWGQVVLHGPHCVTDAILQDCMGRGRGEECAHYDVVLKENALSVEAVVCVRVCVLFYRGIH